MSRQVLTTTLEQLKNACTTCQIIVRQLLKISHDYLFLETHFQMILQASEASSHCLKITQNVAFDFLILAFSTNFCSIKTDLSGNTV